MSDELRKVSRRSFLGQVAGGAAGVGAIALVGGSSPAAASVNHETVLDPVRPGDSDPSDPSQSDSDPRGYNRYGGSGGCTDSDRGRYGDRPGHGRRCGYRRRSCSDSDTGRYGDRVGHGRRC